MGEKMFRVPLVTLMLVTVRLVKMYRVYLATKRCLHQRLSVNTRLLATWYSDLGARHA